MNFNKEGQTLLMTSMDFNFFLYLCANFPGWENSENLVTV